MPWLTGGFWGRLFGKSSPTPVRLVRGTEMSASGQSEAQALRDAMMSDELKGAEFEIIRSDGTPEQMADDLIKSSLPKAFFSDVDLATDIGKAQLLAMFVSRPRGASIEKDEIVSFVNRNKAHMRELMEQLLPHFREAAANIDGGDGIVTFIDYFGTQARHAYAGRPELIDIKSDRLLWLIYALALQLRNGQISYTDALDCLRKPAHFDRISNLSLVFMLRDYAESLGESSQPDLDYPMLVGEAARLKNLPGAASAAFAIVVRTREAGSGENILRYLDNQLPYLASHRPLDAEDSADVERIRKRFAAPMKPEDF